MIRAAFLALLLTLPLFASSPEYLVGDTRPVAADKFRMTPVTASDGTDYFVVWTDFRTGVRSLIGTRVTREGRILDPLGIRISGTAEWMSSPQVAWDGEAYLVAWSAAQREDLSSNVYVARIAANGTMVMPPRLLIANATIDGEGEALASGHGVNVLVYANADGAGRVAVFDRDGENIRQDRVASAGDILDPSIAPTSSGFIVTWTAFIQISNDNYVVEAVALDATGHPKGAPKTIGLGAYPSIATNGEATTIAWIRNYQWDEWSLRSRTFDANLVSVGQDLTHFTIERQVSRVDVLPVGSHFEILAERAVTGGVYEVVSISVDTNGAPGRLQTRNQVIGELWFNRPAPASNGSDIIVARLIQAGNTMQVVAQFYPGNSLAPTAPALLSWSGNAHHDPQMASGPAGYFVAWVENDGAYATRIDAAGRSLDGRGIRLTDFAYSMARVAFDGTNWVVAYRDSTKIKVRYISPADGSTVAETALRANNWSNFSLAESPNATYVVYTNAETSVTRISHATHTEDAAAPMVVSPADMIVDHPVASWNGSELLVVWSDMYYAPRADPPIAYPVQILAARVTAQLALLDPAPLIVASVAPSDGDFSRASVASNGRDWLVLTTFNGTDVLARRVAKEGLVVGSGPTKIGEGITPVATWDGTRYAVAWQAGEALARTRTVLLHSVDGYNSMITATNRTFVAQEVVAEGGLSIAPAANAAAAVAYVKVSYRPEHAGVQRSFFRVMDHGTAPRGRVIRR